ncbi:MAG: MDR family oxidoreductase [Rhodocyclaceae bacterium]|jgi:alcohol dehydrogenase/acrylyl-CoA reductase (NADPH)|nr:MDR family oxidoreductase [Rhodocyclaceae bacterium]
MADKFTAVVIEDVEGKAKTSFKQLSLADLPDNDVLVEVAYSGLNYKDGLALSGNKNKVARKLPMVGGIDIAGTVVESRSEAWKPGDKVVVNGWGMSESQWGGYTRYQRVKSEWLVRLPDAFTLEQAMAIGTAGYTAALCVEALENWGAIKPGQGEVLVTGAAGGVGSVAIALLAARGYNVTASTGRPETHEYLKHLGASAFIDRKTLEEKGGPMQKERWSGAVDSVGGVTLANVLAQTVYGGAVAACGLAGGADLPATVLPHILRGVTLLGIDSVMAPLAKRQVAWARLARDLDQAKLAEMTTVEPMSKLPELAATILAGQTRGRVVIDVTR